ncbi:extracellular solute-binding protein [Paenibacillus sp. URB8-2]|uniref:extracellular solute-binding protein n=1 Tax=Paenibacillus sp. URB8-2 TaxID=2741301 RepID=UPI0015BC7805|nr:extracellular solute-binding protein [Paenibacillus sp. URB8-2]BCG57050.1 sugar ABC transporter substrate-binding protein [Paenibacillus sp. URB8-2]
MEKMSIKRFGVWSRLTALSLLVAIPLAACGNSSNQSGSADAAKEGGGPVTLTMLYSESGSPFNKDWPIYKELQARTNVKLDLQVVPESDYQSKAKIVLSSDKIPDLVTNINQSNVLELGGTGVLLPISDYMDKLPNLKKRIEEFKMEDELENWKSPDGKLYVLPFLTQSASYNRSPMIRTDLLEKYGLKAPTNTDELYTVLKKMKEMNPGSYPFTGTSADDLRSMWGAAWGIEPSYKGFIFNEQTGKYEYIYTSENYKKYVSYLNKLIKEGLADPELFTSNYDQMHQKLSTSKSMFYFFWNGEEISNINLLGKKNTGPEFKMAMLPPIAGPAGEKALAGTRIDRGTVIPASAANKPYFEDLLKFADYLYSDEGIDLLTWGIEGDSYVVKEDGKKEFTDKMKQSENLNRALWDIGSANGSFTLVWPFKWFATILGNEDFEKYTEEANKNNWFTLAAKVPKLSTDQKDEESLMIAGVNDYYAKMQEQFVYGKMSIDQEWDSYVKEIHAKGVDKLLDIYNSTLK